MRTLAYALQSILFDSSAYTDARRMRFAPNCNTSPGLVIKITVWRRTRKKKSGKHSGKASRDPSIAASYRLGSRTASKLIPEVCEAICYAVFLWLPCESIPPRQRFHLADKLITARESNAHVRTCAYKVKCTVRCLSRTKWSIRWPLLDTFIIHTSFGCCVGSPVGLFSLCCGTDITAIVRIKKGLWLLVYTNSVNKKWK